MRCRACNEVLALSEDLRAYASTGEKIGLCDICIAPVQRDIDHLNGDPFLEDEFDHLEFNVEEND